MVALALALLASRDLVAESVGRHDEVPSGPLLPTSKIRSYGDRPWLVGLLCSPLRGNARGPVPTHHRGPDATLSTLSTLFKVESLPDLLI